MKTFSSSLFYSCHVFDKTECGFKGAEQTKSAKELLNRLFNGNMLFCYLQEKKIQKYKESQGFCAIAIKCETRN